ncbi:MULTISPECIES: hypothetical protein [Xanthomonas]|uniref:hypothetical protein n=1 Tax=Xanthomonas TaxID=338 RepID=UPI000AD6974F|nr:MULTISPECIES: hypothetical protein [Xanthomonas]MBB3848265.1 hypothetical protein [Xanthomonas arboricola]UKE47454.1 hypothetical protein KHA79_01585 [Xanthomonas translucens pv. cerealis]
MNALEKKANREIQAFRSKQDASSFSVSDFKPETATINEDSIKVSCYGLERYLNPSSATFYG